MGIEPTSLAWEAGILPMNYTRIDFYSLASLGRKCKNFADGSRHFANNILPVILQRGSLFLYNVSGRDYAKIGSSRIRFWENEEKVECL